MNHYTDIFKNGVNEESLERACKLAGLIVKANIETAELMWKGPTMIWTTQQKQPESIYPCMDIDGWLWKLGTKLAYPKSFTSTTNTDI